TPGDMALYMQILMKGGAGVISKESFAKFTKPYIDAAELGPTSKYGYGIGVDHLDGHVILRHTGGMASFMSSITVDLDAGVAAFRAGLRTRQWQGRGAIARIRLVCERALYRAENIRHASAVRSVCRTLQVGQSLVPLHARRDQEG